MAACSSAESAISSPDAGLLSSPVKDAKADPLPPLTFDEPCDKDSAKGPSTSKAAIHTFAGKSITDLAGLRALVDHPNEAVSSGPTSFDRTTVSEIHVNTAGVAMVRCAAGETVLFVLPQ
jgi:hypothetical protein